MCRSTTIEALIRCQRSIVVMSACGHLSHYVPLCVGYVCSCTILLQANAHSNDQPGLEEFRRHHRVTSSFRILNQLERATPLGRMIDEIDWLFQSSKRQALHGCVHKSLTFRLKVSGILHRRFCRLVLARSGWKTMGKHLAQNVKLRREDFAR